MNEIFTPVWWFSVVFVGIVINVLSSYLKKFLDNFLSNISSWWRKKSTARQQAWEECVERLVEKEEEKIQSILEENRMRLQSIFFMVVSIILFLFFNYLEQSNVSIFIRLLAYLSLPVSSLLAFVSILEWESANNKEKAIKEAKKRLSASDNIL